MAGLHDTGFDEGEAWAITDRVRVLLALPRPSTIGGAPRSADGRLMAGWLRIEHVRTAIGVNTWEGVEYVDRGRFDVFLEWAVRLDTVDVGGSGRGSGECGDCPAPVRGGERGRLPRRSPAGTAPFRVGPEAAQAPDVGLLMDRQTAVQSKRMRRSNEVGGAPWPMTDSRWVR